MVRFGWGDATLLAVLTGLSPAVLGDHARKCSLESLMKEATLDEKRVWPSCATQRWLSCSVSTSPSPHLKTRDDHSLALSTLPKGKNRLEYWRNRRFGWRD